MDLQQYLISPSLLFPAIAAIFATVLFLYHLLIPCRKRTQPLQPPEASRAWPIMGHLHLLAGPQPAHKTLAQMADKHGPIFTMRMGVHRALVVSSSEIARDRECFTTNDKAFANPIGVASEVMTYNFAMFGFNPYGSYWRQARKIATLELLSNHRLEALRHVRESEVKTAVNELYEFWADDSRDRVGIEIKKWFGDVTRNVVFRMVVGKRYLEATSTSESKSCDDGDRCRKALKDFFEFIP